MTIGQCVCRLPAPQPVLLLLSRRAPAPAMLVTSGYYNSTYSYTQLHVHSLDMLCLCSPNARCSKCDYRNFSQLVSLNLTWQSHGVDLCLVPHQRHVQAAPETGGSAALHAAIFTVSCVSFHSQQKALTGSHQGQLIIRVTIHKLLHINPSPLQMYHIYYTIYLILTVYMHIKSLADWRWDSIWGYAEVAPHIGSLYIG